MAYFLPLLGPRAFFAAAGFLLRPRASRRLSVPLPSWERGRRSNRFNMRRFDGWMFRIERANQNGAAASFETTTRSWRRTS